MEITDTVTNMLLICDYKIIIPGPFKITWKKKKKEKKKKIKKNYLKSLVQEKPVPTLEL